MKNLRFLVAFLSVGFMFVCLFSGLIITFEFDPMNVYESVQRLTYKVDYGEFYRKVHYFSGELFLVFVIIHIFLELLQKDKIKSKSWNYAIIATLASIFLMFTGYVLKGDLNGTSAGQIAISMLSDTPILDIFTPFIKDTNAFFWRFFIWHVMILPFILLFALYFHSPIFSKYFIIALGVTLVFVYFVALPQDLNPNLSYDKVTGPWFFKGEENLLIYGLKAPFVILFLALPFGLLFLIKFKENYRKISLFLLAIWTILYAFISLV